MKNCNSLLTETFVNIEVSVQYPFTISLSILKNSIVWIMDSEFCFYKYKFILPKQIKS